MEKITEKTTLAEILKEPKLVGVLEIGKVYDLYQIEVEKVFKELNEAIKE